MNLGTMNLNDIIELWDLGLEGQDRERFITDLEEHFKARGPGRCWMAEEGAEHCVTAKTYP